MTTNTTAALAAAIDDRAKAEMEHFTAFSGPFHVVATVASIAQALADRRWKQPTMALAATIHAGAMGQGPARACFCCDRAWHDRRRPVTFLLAELWTAQGACGLVSAICAPCASHPDLHRHIGVGLQRDLGADPSTVRIIEKEGRA